MTAEFDRAVALHRAGDLAGAERRYRAILEQRECADAYGNLALILWRGGNPAEAEAALLRALELGGPNADRSYNLGNLYRRTRRLRDAAAAYEAALSIDPHHALAVRNLADVYLAQSRFAEGWPLYDHRPTHIDCPLRSMSFPEWQGEPLTGKSLLIWGEQGIGDQIFALRFLPLIDAASTTFAVMPELLRLVSPFVTKALPKLGPVVFQDHDYWSMPLSIPRWVHGSPPSSAYLSAQPKGPGGIGVAWRGSASPDPGRSLPPELGRELLALTGAISLLPEDSGAGDMLETAEIVAGLDLVISVDTSVAHLAGAMGKPCWLLLQHYGEDWRWREAHPGVSAWYPSVQILRQPRPGDWRGVLDAVSARLAV